jgi:hypothetical protein
MDGTCNIESLLRQALEGGEEEVLGCFLVVRLLSYMQCHTRNVSATLRTQARSFCGSFALGGVFRLCH